MIGLKPYFRQRGKHFCIYNTFFDVPEGSCEERTAKLALLRFIRGESSQQEELMFRDLPGYFRFGAFTMSAVHKYYLMLISLAVQRDELDGGRDGWIERTFYHSASKCRTRLLDYVPKPTIVFFFCFSAGKYHDAAR